MVNNLKSFLKNWCETKERVFSKKIQIANLDIYFLYEITVNSFNNDLNLENKLEDNNKLDNSIISNARIEPIAILIKEYNLKDDFEYYLEPLKEENKKYINKYLNEIINEFTEEL